MMQSKWLIALTIYLRQYKLLLTNVIRISQNCHSRKKVEKEYKGNDKENCLRLWCLLVQEINRMEDDQGIREEYLKGQVLFESRVKRSVIPIMGKALNVLFGTVTEEELRIIMDRRSNLKKINEP